MMLEVLMLIVVRDRIVADLHNRYYFADQPPEVQASFGTQDMVHASRQKTGRSERVLPRSAPSALQLDLATSQD